MKHCDLCGSPVKVCGKLTLHYEPNLPSEEEIADIIFRDKNIIDHPHPTSQTATRKIEGCRKLAQAISKRLRVE